MKSAEYTMADDPEQTSTAIHSSGGKITKHPGEVGATIQSPESTIENQVEISTMVKFAEYTITDDPEQTSTAMHSSGVQ